VVARELEGRIAGEAGVVIGVLVACEEGKEAPEKEDGALVRMLAGLLAAGE
jgi:hypothetical protein